MQQYYEALVGTLKAAKKRGIVDFKGQMLLKGAHDSVMISLCEGGVDRGAAAPTPAPAASISGRSGPPTPPTPPTPPGPAGLRPPALAPAPAPAPAPLPTPVPTPSPVPPLSSSPLPPTPLYQ